MKSSRGFTLIEVIIILIVMSLAATLFISYMGTSFSKSPASANLVDKQYRLIEQMEILTSKYRQALPTDGSALDLCAFKTANVDGLQIDGKSIVDAANTSCTYPITDTTNTYTTRSALLVTLLYDNQRIQSIFTN